MNIKINKDMDEFQKSFWKSIGPREIKYGLAATIACTVWIIFLYPKVGMTVAAYTSILIGGPIGFIGFYKKNGMNFAEVREGKRKIKNQPVLLYRSEEGMEQKKVVSKQKNVTENKDPIERLVEVMMSKKQGGTET